MKRLVLILLCFVFLPCQAKDKNIKLQNIFITDTTEVEEYVEPDTTTLKGYAEYIEDSEAVHLKDDHDEFVLNLKVPQKITSKSLINSYNPSFAAKPITYSKFGAEEYQIIPTGKNATVYAGDLSFGTSFGQDVDISELEHTAGFFTAYEKGPFKVKTGYSRTIGSTYSNYSDSVYFTPEIKINKVFSLKPVLSANVVTRRKKSELVLLIKPFAYTNDDRLNLEIGAGQTYSPENDVIRSKIRFSTRFKL